MDNSNTKCDKGEAEIVHEKVDTENSDLFSDFCLSIGSVSSRCRVRELYESQFSNNLHSSRDIWGPRLDAALLLCEESPKTVLRKVKKS